MALDASTLVSYLAGDTGADVEAAALAIDHMQAVLPPVVLSELLSDPELPAAVRESPLCLPRLEVLDGYWERAGLLRARILARCLRARLPDTLIAQSCIDHEVELVSRDGDFRHFVRAGGLRVFGARRSR